MKVAITGHTGGLGLAFLHYFAEKHYEVVGYSRTNGYDISNLEVVSKIIAEIKDVDIFVNNAHDANQFVLLERVFNMWLGKPKTIINISSRFTGELNTYSVEKLKQDQFCQEKIYQLPRILNVKPGLVDTQRVAHINKKKMTTDNVIEVVDYCLKNNVQSITFGK